MSKKNDVKCWCTFHVVVDASRTARVSHEAASDYTIHYIGIMFVAGTRSHGRHPLLMRQYQPSSFWHQSGVTKSLTKCFQVLGSSLHWFFKLWKHIIMQFFKAFLQINWPIEWVYVFTMIIRKQVYRKMDSDTQHGPNTLKFVSIDNVSAEIVYSPSNAYAMILTSHTISQNYVPGPGFEWTRRTRPVQCNILSGVYNIDSS